MEIDLNPDGPHSPDRTAEAAEVFDACSRYLVYATMRGGQRAGELPRARGLEYPSEAYRLLGEVYSATGRLAQLAIQLSAFLDAQGQTGRLGDSNGRDVAERIATASFHLGAAHTSAQELTGSLQAAQGAIAGLYVKEADDA